MTRTSPSAAAVLDPYLATQIEIIDRMHPLARVGDPDAIHDMRVAVRRLKAVLTAYRPVFEPATARQLCAELDWLAASLGHARDHEVQRLILLDVAANEDERAGVDAADRAMAVEARAALSSDLVSARYRGLAEELDRFAANPPWKAAAHRRARKVLVPSLSKQFARVEARVEAAQESGRSRVDERLHRVRKSVKRARYATEASAPILTPTAAALAHRLADAQDTLGAHNDLVVTRANSDSWLDLAMNALTDDALKRLDVRARKSRSKTRRALGSVSHIAEAGRSLVGEV